MLPEHFYFTGAGWLGYFIYVPVALLVTGLIYQLLLRRISLLVIRWPVMIIVSIVLITWPLWGALAISYQAEKLCKEQGGLHVYKRVETDGFIGLAGIKKWSEYGFTYIERGGLNNKKYRYAMKNGEEVREEINEYTSRYQTGSSEGFKKLTNNIKSTSFYVKDRVDNKVLGELVTIGIYPSSFDLFILHLLPVEYNAWQCGNEAPKGKGMYSSAHKKYLYSTSDVIESTLIPMKDKE